MDALPDRAAAEIKKRGALRRNCSKLDGGGVFAFHCACLDFIKLLFSRSSAFFRFASIFSENLRKRKRCPRPRFYSSNKQRPIFLFPPLPPRARFAPARNAATIRAAFRNGPSQSQAHTRTCIFACLFFIPLIPLRPPPWTITARIFLIPPPRFLRFAYACKNFFEKVTL